MTNREQVVLNGRYELHRRVGRGGMAEVYLARDRLLDRLVAIKILFPEFATDPSFVARFRREAQAAANLNHPNIVGVYDWGKERGTYYIVMEYVDGRTVSDLLRADGPIEAKKAASIAADVAAALGFAHRKGVVHRDVKPGNVLITDGGEVKVADFGIARAMTSNGEENLTQTGSVMGTATYFSPEQAQGKDIDARTDLYSLGVVLYEMAAGKPPFTGTSPVAIAYKHVQEPVPPLAEQAPGVASAYEAITNRALAKDPADRYPDAMAMRSDLLRFRDGRPVTTGAVTAAAAVAAPVAAVAATRAVPPAVVAPTPVPLRGRPLDEYEYEERSHSGWFFAAILALLLVLGLLLFLFAKQLGIFDKPVKQVAVPTVVGSKKFDATNRLRAAGFEVKSTSKEDPAAAVDTVLSQDPGARRRVKEGSTVKLVISSGPGQANLEGLVDLNLDQAKAKLLALGFTAAPTVVSEPSLGPEGLVVRTEPFSPGGPYPKNEPIKLILRSAPVTTTAAPVTTTRPVTTTTQPITTTTRPVTTTTRPVTTTTAQPVTTTTKPPTTTTKPPTTTTKPPTTTTKPPTTTTKPPITTTTTKPPITTTTAKPPPSTTSPTSSSTVPGG